MSKRFSSVALLVLLLSSAVSFPQTSSHPRNGTKQQQSTKEKQSRADALSNGSITVIENHSDSRDKTNCADKEPESVLKRAIAPESWPHWALFVAAVIAAWITLHTLRAIEDEAKEIRKVGEAANQNALALINSERAWVTVFVEWVKGATNLTTVGDGTEVFINLICSNRGHSPAWIVERVIKAEISDGFYGPDISTVHDSMIDRQLMPLAPSGVDGCREDLRCKEYAQGTSRKKFVLIYGVVRYRDVFTPDKLRETWFGFHTSEDAKYDPLTRIHHPEYNKYT